MRKNRSAARHGSSAPNRFLVTTVLLVAIAACSAPAFSQRRTASSAQSGAAVLTITTEPNAIVWIDDVRRGTTDATGKLSLNKVSAGRHAVRVRATGFKETTVPLLPARRGNLAVRLLRTTDAAELAFQEAETKRELAKTEADRQTAVAAYRRALQLRPIFPAAHLGLARLMLDLNDYKEALGEIEAARAARPVYAEASAVEGRIHREGAFEDEAVKSFRRSIREAHGFQPEAHVGLARVFEEKGQLDEAIAEYRKALDQLSDSEPVIYQLLGAAYEKQQKYKEAVAAYEKYLALAPNGSLAPALRSIIDQLKRDAAGQEIVP